VRKAAVGNTKVWHVRKVKERKKKVPTFQAAAWQCAAQAHRCRLAQAFHQNNSGGRESEAGGVNR